MEVFYGLIRGSKKVGYKFSKIFSPNPKTHANILRFVFKLGIFSIFAYISSYSGNNRQFNKSKKNGKTGLIKSNQPIPKRAYLK